MAKLSMEELLAKQDQSSMSVTRGQAVKGVVVAINQGEIVLDLGTKAEGILAKKDLPQNTLESLKLGDSIECFVVYQENDAGQVVLSLQRNSSRIQNFPRWTKLKDAMDNKQLVTGTGIEVNKGGLVVEVSGIRGFLPSSQASLSHMATLDQFIGQQLKLKVLEVDAEQNRLIFAEYVEITPEQLQASEQIKPGQKMSGVIQSLLPFGLYLQLEGELEGLVHISELSWDRTDEPMKAYTVGQTIEGQVVSVDKETNRINLSIKSLIQDPFSDIIEKYESDDVVKGTVTKVSPQGIVIALSGGGEGVILPESVEAGKVYAVGETLTLLIDRIDNAKRRILLAPFLTSTSGLIYK